jgi:hypothetical protein
VASPAGAALTSASAPKPPFPTGRGERSPVCRSAGREGADPCKASPRSQAEPRSPAGAPATTSWPGRRPGSASTVRHAEALPAAVDNQGVAVYEATLGRRLGAMSKAGDRYLRTQLISGARAALPAEDKKMSVQRISPASLRWGSRCGRPRRRCRLSPGTWGRRRTRPGREIRRSRAASTASVLLPELPASATSETVWRH